MKKIIFAVLAASLVLTSTPATAEGVRADEVAAFKAKYDSQFDAVLAKFTTAQKKLAFDSSSAALIKNSIANLGRNSQSH